MTSRRSQIVSWGALVLGLLLLAATVWVMDLSAVRAEIRSLGLALPLVLLASGAWHLARTVAWAACFRHPRRVGFWRLARVRLAAEAFSYLTIRGIAGEPLKVVLLREDVDPREATAAVALERLAYMVLTTVTVGIGALIAIATLPLSSIWFRIFRGFAIGAGVLVLIACGVLTGRGTYVERLLGRSKGPVARFIVAVERQLLELARHNARRLLVLVAMNVLCYASMALEVWIVLRAVGVPASLIGSLAVETFSRVASFASAFIPANIGALEATSLAAVGAIGAGGGGAALALARRIRGIFWAAAGLLIYPRASWGSSRVDDPSKGVLRYSVPEGTPDVSVFARVAGLPVAERVFRAAHKVGCREVRLDAPEPAFAAPATARSRVERLSRIARHVGLSIVPPEDLREPILRAEAGDIPRPGAGFSMMSTRVRIPADLPAAEREIRSAVFKPTDHNLARFNRRMSLPISVALLRTPLTANQFSVALLFLGLYSAWLFGQGTYLTGLAGAAVSLAASILDGCDGEIARLKHQESDFGCWLETVTDYTYYFAIFAGMTVGAARHTGLQGYYVVGGLALMGMATAFTLLLYLRHRMTRHSPSRFAGTVKGKFKEGGGRLTLVLAKLSNVATRAQMPYGIMALAIGGALPLVVILCAIGANTYWMALAWKLRALIGEERRAALTGVTG
jgi:phosphatidylglycerophosphate synthase